MADHLSGTAEYHLVVDKSKAPLFEVLCRLLNETCHNGGSQAHIEEMHQQHPGPYRHERVCCCCCARRLHHETSQTAWPPPHDPEPWAPPTNRLSICEAPPGPRPIPGEPRLTLAARSSSTSGSSDLSDPSARHALYGRDDDKYAAAWAGFHAAAAAPRPRPFPRPVPPPPPYPNPPKGRSNYPGQMDDTAQAMRGGYFG
ncbi:hypothetical protein F4775DRAFT_593245 [Biscogniauxia sp. FL1348]|nr:hypothetical protein F4775DRAFT_593245 [Biscogniauxia sp. FL1348]